jgi:hypothetical protein
MQARGLCHGGAGLAHDRSSVGKRGRVLVND